VSQQVGVDNPFEEFLQEMKARKTKKGEDSEDAREDM